ncbi:uncharacterized protein LOC131936348 [Physella acuta]|uniref:uncharacterized protein LOC131936348 n=1 Tax=Physella acuta TaxID=109671 RepID=UPI0027DD9299|nr:uncharacterized protein LOC131936348 [Physella acuta]
MGCNTSRSVVPADDSDVTKSRSEALEAHNENRAKHQAPPRSISSDVPADDSDITRFRTEALAAHNEFRAKHQAPPLTLSSDVPADDSDITRFRTEALAAHNEFRAKHQAPPLTLSDDLNEYAQNYANHLAKIGKMVHSDCDMNGERLGENLAYKWTSAPGGADMTGAEPTEMWYSEIEDFKRYGDASNIFSGTGHFTQVVWKSSKQLGMGKAKTSDGKVFAVGSYRPPGNYVGNYKENVLPPKNKAETVRSYRSEETHGTQRVVRTTTTTTTTSAGKTTTYKTETTVKEVVPQSTGIFLEKEKKSFEISNPRAQSSKFIQISKGSDSRSTQASEPRPQTFKETFKIFAEKDKKSTPQPSTTLQVLLDKDSKTKFQQSPTFSPLRTTASAIVQPKVRSLEQFRQDALRAHNVRRARHGVPPLVLKPDLNDYAQNYASQMARTNSFQHSDCRLGGARIGENIAYKYSSAGLDYTGEEVTEGWYSEVKDHSYMSEGSTYQRTGHFTQVVWKDTKELGIGRATSPDGKVFVVGSYRPAGNVIGSFRFNVFPPKR